MFGHIGFSYTGLIYLLMLFIPNIIWSKNLPKNYQKVVDNSLFFFTMLYYNEYMLNRRHALIILYKGWDMLIWEKLMILLIR